MQFYDTSTHTNYTYVILCAYKLMNEMGRLFIKLHSIIPIFNCLIHIFMTYFDKFIHLFRLKKLAWRGSCRLTLREYLGCYWGFATTSSCLMLCFISLESSLIPSAHPFEETCSTGGTMNLALRLGMLGRTSPRFEIHTLDIRERD